MTNKIYIATCLIFLVNLSFADKTFILDKKLKKQKWKEWHVFEPVKIALKTKLATYKKNKKGKYVLCKDAFIEFCDVPCKKILSSKTNSFVYTVYVAYDRHRKIVISPDDIWLLIMQQLSIHINQQSRKWRKKLVGFSGKKLLAIRRDKFILGSTENDWGSVPKELSKMISVNLKTDLRKAIAPEFSTTTPTIQTAFDIVLMKTTENYFEYAVDTFCGIPAITLTGTTEDWKKLKQKAKLLDKFGLSYWRRELDPILKEFIDASKGKVKKTFWEKILKREFKSPEGLMIDGWIMKFFPYVIAVNSDRYTRNPFLKNSLRNTKGLSIDRIPEGINSVSFKWNYLGETFKMAFQSGFMGTAEDPKDNSVRAVIGWGIKNLDYYKVKKVLSGKLK